MFPGYDTKQPDSEAPVMLGYEEYKFITVAPSSILAQKGSTGQGLIYESNRTAWHLNSMQLNDQCFIELLEI